jgi:hypothetical protein
VICIKRDMAAVRHRFDQQVRRASLQLCQEHRSSRSFLTYLAQESTEAKNLQTEAAKMTAPHHKPCLMFSPMVEANSISQLETSLKEMLHIVERHWGH